MEDKYYDITKLHNKLYVGGAIIDYKKLNELGIETVVNCRAEQHDDIAILSDLGINYFYIPLVDSDSGRFDQLATFYKIVEESYGPVLVHCMQGRGRSVIMAAAWMMIKLGYHPLDALDRIKRDRPFIMPTERQVKKLEGFREWYNAL